MTDRANALEREWMGRVARLGCVLCMILGTPQTTPTHVHHAKEGTGIGERSPHFLTIALCAEHHQGASGIHGLGTRGFYTRYKVDELDLLNLTIEGVYRAMARAKPIPLVRVKVADEGLFALFLGEFFLGAFTQLAVTPLANAIGRALGQYPIEEPRENVAPPDPRCARCWSYCTICRPSPASIEDATTHGWIDRAAGLLEAHELKLVASKLRASKEVIPNLPIYERTKA